MYALDNRFSDLHELSTTRCATQGCTNLAEPRDTHCIPCELSGAAWDKPQKPPAPEEGGQTKRFLRPGALEERLAERGMAQAELARKLGLTPALVTMWIRRRKAVHPTWWPQLAVLLDLDEASVEALFDKVEIPAPECQDAVSPTQLVRVLVGLDDLGYGAPISGARLVTLQTHTFSAPGLAA